MADISNDLNKIRTAIYGKDVRSSIADGIDSINKEVEENTKHVDSTSTDIQNFKNEINQAEAIRVKDENERKSSESNRVDEFNSMKNQFDTLKNNSNAATNNANSAANTANSAAGKVDGAINDLKSNNIGCTNLLTGTQWFNNGWYVGYGTACTIDRVNLFEGCAVLTSTYDWTYYCQDYNYYEVGKQYTISCYAKSDNGKAQISFTVASDKVAWQRTTTTTSWKKYSITFIATKPTGNVRIENCGTKDGADKIYISKIKLEKGVVATDWSSSPFDKQDELKNFGSVNLFDNTDFSEPLSLYESTANVLFQQDISIQSQSSIFYKDKNIVGISSQGDSFGDTYCTFIRTNDRVIQANTTYTLSFWYMSLHANGDISSSSYLYLNKTAETNSGELIPLDDLDLNSHGANWTKYTKTFTTGDTIKNIQLRLGFRCSAYSWMVVDGLKLERGRIATDWNFGNTDISNKLKKASDINAPQSHDCNDFKTPELSFWWDTGIDGFKNTPLGFLPKDSARVFHVKNEGTEGRLIQTFNMVYPQYTNSTWTRCYNSDVNAGWSEWVTNFTQEKQINSGDDWNAFIDIGCYKVQGMDNSKNTPLTSNGTIYAYGILNVFNSAIKEETRTLQVYYPHQADTNGYRIVYYRMYNTDKWTDWSTLGGDVYKKDVPFINNHKDVNVSEGNTSWASDDIKHLLDLWGASYNQGGNITFSALGDDKVNFAIDGDFYGLEGQVGVCKSINANTNQIKSHNDTLYDLQHNWFSDCSNSLCINGFTSLKVYPQGVYYITGTAVTILESIDHSAMKNGQCIYFIAETCDQTANIKFPASLSSSSVYTPKGQDFWITGRDNGDLIYTMQKIGGALRFRSL